MIPNTSAYIAHFENLFDVRYNNDLGYCHTNMHTNDGYPPSLKTIPSYSHPTQSSDLQQSLTIVHSPPLTFHHLILIYLRNRWHSCHKPSPRVKRLFATLDRVIDKIQYPVVTRCDPKGFH